MTPARIMKVERYVSSFILRFNWVDEGISRAWIKHLLESHSGRSVVA